MSGTSGDSCTEAQSINENGELRRQLEEAQQTLEAIRHGDVDALVVIGPQGEQVYSLAGVEHVYRVIVETMNEAALTVDPDGTILFCNQRFCDLMRTSIQGAMGHKVTQFVARPQQPPLKAVLAGAQAGPVQRRLTFRAVDGTVVPIQLSASPLQAGDSLSICLVASDLTELEASANSIRVLREHQQALEESEERFGAFMDNSTAIAWLKDEAGHYVYLSKPYERRFGVSVKNWRGLTDFALWPRETAEQFRRSDLQVLQTGQTLTCIEETIGPHGSRSYWWNSKFLIQDGQSRRYVGGIGVDITERKRAEEELKRSRARLGWVLETTGVGTWLNELPFGRLNWDEQTRRLFFAPSDGEVTIELFWSRLHPEDREPTRRAVEKAIHDHTLYDIEHRAVNPDTGEVRWIRSVGQATYAPDGTAVRFDGINYDITAWKQAEKSLRELNVTLESKVAQRTAQLQHRAQQLQKLTLELTQAEERERRRIALILHEDLQQQIAGAKFHLNLVKGRAGDDRLRTAAEEVDEMLKEAIEKSRNLSHDLSPAVLNMNDLAEVLQWLARRVRAQHGLTVRVDVSGQMTLQSDALTMFLFRAAQEMLVNVVKHARVMETVIRVRRRGRYVCLCVSDEGQGFNPRELRDTAGLGLLSIRERVELLGGRMKIRSAKGKGSTLRIVVPDGPKKEDREQKADDGRQKGEEELPSAVVRSRCRCSTSPRSGR